VRAGNRVTEKDLREWLGNNGWDHRSAKIDQLELHAVRRPGWEQVFRFSGRALKETCEEAENPDFNADHFGETSDSASWHPLWGVIHDDERFKANKPTIWLFDDEDEQADKLSELSEDLVTLRHGKTSVNPLPTIAIVAAVIAMACLAKFFAQ
jgi:hypothetical protein